MQATKQFKGRAGKTAAANSQKPGIVTERDGRAFAIDLLQTLESEIEKDVKAGFSHYSAQAEGDATGLPPEIGIYRKRAQSSTLARRMGDLFARATPAALGGFFTVWTDWVGSSIDGSTASADEYVLQEMAGKLPAWGSVVYANSTAARAALAAGKNSYTLE